MDLVLLIGLPVLLGVGYLIWTFRFRWNRTALPEAPTRRREDARDWQRWFGAESLLTANFLQPTQNEILETLYVLDHLTPGWETGDPAVDERRLLDELALNFPTLRKAGCVFPLPFAESLPALSAKVKSARTPPINEVKVAAQREEFRVARAQANALEQIVSGPARPETATPGSLPFRVSENGTSRRGGHSWPAALAGAAALGATVYGLVRLLPGHPPLPMSPPAEQRAAAALAQTALDETPTEEESQEPTPVETQEAEASPTPEGPAPAPLVPAPTTAVIVATAVTPPTLPAPPVAPKPDPRVAELDRQIAASKQRALGKYPALAVEGSEINLRFVFRYKALRQQNSPRLRDPNWPEQLAAECAADSESPYKRSAYTQVQAAHH